MTGTVLITDCDMGPADLERTVLESAGWTVVHRTCRSEVDVLDALEETAATGLLVQYAPITRKVFESFPRLRGLVRYGVGLDTVDLEAAREHGVAALNVPDYGSAEVADHATSLLTSLLRGVPWWGAATAAGQWPSRGAFPEPRELAETTLGLCGFGAIAREVSRRAQAFGMTVLAHDPFVAPDVFGDAGVEAVGGDELWERSDAVSLHMPLVEGTHGIADARRLALLGPGGILVNTARGGLVDRDALATALDDGTLSGVGLDVWWTEPADPADPLLSHPRVLATPHVAWLSPGSVRRLRTSAATRLLNVLTTEVPA